MFSKIYKINFHTNGGNEIEAISCKYKNSFPELPNPIREGYKFIGWFNDIDCIQEAKYEKMIKKDIDLYAKWEFISIDEFINDVDFFTKSANILKSLQNDYEDVPDFKDPIIKKPISKKTTTKKASASKKKTTTKKTTAKKATTKKTTGVKVDSKKKAALKVEKPQNEVIVKEEINDNTGN